MSPTEPARRAHAIVLAGGAAARFNGAKLLATFRGEPLIAAAVRTALATDVGSVTVVTGSGAGKIEAALDDLKERRLTFVHNAGWRDGLAGSLRCGLAHLPSNAEAVLVFLGDMPNVSAATGDCVLRLVAEGALAAYPSYAGRPGHPVALSRALFPEITALQGDQGARSLLADRPGVRTVECDDIGCVQDVDTPQDLAALLNDSRSIQPQPGHR